MKKIEEKKSLSSRIKIVYASSQKFFGAEAGNFFEKLKDEAEVVKVFGDGLSSSDLQNFFQTRGIFESISLIYLKNAERMAKETSKRLLDFIRNPLPSVFLFVEYEGDLSEKNKKLDPVWREICSVIKPENLNPHSAKAYILKRAKQQGIDISESALFMLESWAGKDLHLLPSAMDILCLAGEESKKITEEDVSDLLGTGGSASIFELQDKFLSRDDQGISEAIKKVENDASASPIAFVSTVAKQMTYIGKIHSLVKSGVSIGAISPEMVEKGLQWWQLQKAKEKYSNWGEKQILKALSEFALLDKAIKGDPVEPWTAVEIHLLKLLRQ
ncbi:MAG: DNA polymerase III subunit delta [Acidobacteria bacterium]|nr:DNA polymerase III subunit delta [Acidobacteriota bacterium]